MPSCMFREKPGLEPTCRMLVDAGEEMCPRHKAMDQARQAAALEKERKHALAGTLHKKLPGTRRGLIEQGYQSIGNGTCSKCHKPIQWFRTPNGRNSPWDPMDTVDSPAVSHFASCEHAQQFRSAA